ncbi:hypothetical protein SK128_020737, partial [Halocaridina rubra]
MAELTDSSPDAISESTDKIYNERSKDCPNNSSNLQASILKTCTEQPSERRHRLAKQILMALGICLNFVNLGVTVAWTNPASSDLKGEGHKTIYNGHIALVSSQMDLLGSLIAAGSLPGKWIAGWLTTRIGRKKSLIFTLFPNLLSWCLIFTAFSPDMIYAGRFIVGIGTGLTGVISSVYNIEIADIGIRGTVGVLPTAALDMGFVIVACLGLLLNWYELCLAAMAMCVLATIVAFFIPESPTYLVVSGKENEARKVLNLLRGPHADIEQEIATLKTMNEGMTKKYGCGDLLKSSYIKSLLIILTLFLTQNFCGLGVLYSNATRMLIESGSALDENIATILVFVFQLMGSVLSCIIMNRFRRKTLLVVSFLICTVVLIIMGIHVYFNAQTDLLEYIQLNHTHIDNHEADEVMKMFPDDYNVNRVVEEKSYGWIPLVCLIAFVVGSNLGLRPIPFILNMEYFPTAIRPQ